MCPQASKISSSYKGPGINGYGQKQSSSRKFFVSSASQSVTDVTAATLERAMGRRGTLC